MPPPPPIGKFEMLVFGLHSTSHDQLSEPNDEKVAQNVKKWLPNRQKMKCSLLDYVQLLMIS